MNKRGKMGIKNKHATFQAPTMGSLTLGNISELGMNYCVYTLPSWDGCKPC